MTRASGALRRPLSVLPGALRRPLSVLPGALRRPMLLALLLLMLLMLGGCTGASRVAEPPPDAQATRSEAFAHARGHAGDAVRGAERAARANAMERAGSRVHMVNELNRGLEDWLDATRAAIPRTRAADLASMDALSMETAALRDRLDALARLPWFSPRFTLQEWAREVSAVLDLWDDLHATLRDGDVGAADLAYEALIETWLQSVRAMERVAAEAGHAGPGFWLP